MKLGAHRTGERGICLTNCWSRTSLCNNSATRFGSNRQTSTMQNTLKNTKADEKEIRSEPIWERDIREA